MTRRSAAEERAPHPPPAAAKTLVAGGWLLIAVALLVAALVRTDVDMCGDPADMPSETASVLALVAVLPGVGALVATVLSARKAGRRGSLWAWPNRLTVLIYLQIGVAFTIFAYIGLWHFRLHC